MDTQENKGFITTFDMRKASKLVKNATANTHKYRRWLKLYIEGGDATAAARIAYHCTAKSASSIASENLKKMDYNAFLEEVGLTDQMLAKKTIEGLSAHKIVTSHTEPDKTVPDFNVRHRYLETAYKLKRRLQNDTVSVVVDKTLLLDAVTVPVIEGGIVSSATGDTV